MFDMIAFDADDTLWHTERLYHLTQEQFKQLLLPYGVNGDIDQKLYETEMRNLRLFGYGVKGFTLSMIETAIELTDGRIPGTEIQKIIDAARQMMLSDIRLLDQVAETIPGLAAQYPLMLITKGDLLEQESKIARSGMADYFQIIEVVGYKDASVYQRILDRYGINPRRFLMVGNSMPSDILPVLALGARAVHIPYEITWAHETADLAVPPEGFYELAHVGQLPALLQRLQAA